MAITVKQIRETLGKEAVVVGLGKSSAYHIGTGLVTESPLGENEPPVVVIPGATEQLDMCVSFSDLSKVNMLPGNEPHQVKFQVPDGYYVEKPYHKDSQN